MFEMTYPVMKKIQLAEEGRGMFDSKEYYLLRLVTKALLAIHR